jgi:hypothetical protein
MFEAQASGTRRGTQKADKSDVTKQAGFLKSTQAKGLVLSKATGRGLQPGKRLEKRSSEVLDAPFLLQQFS